MYKITVYIEEVNEEKKQEEQKPTKEQEEQTSINYLKEFITDNYIVSDSLWKREAKGTDIHADYKKFIKDKPNKYFIGRDNMYQELKKEYNLIIHRRLVYFNLIKK